MALFGLLPDAPKAPDPTKTADTQYQYATKAAQDNLRMNSLNRTGAFGSSTFQKDANGNPTGINTQLSGAVQPGANNTTGNFASQTGLLPSGAFHSNVDASGIRGAYQDNALLQAQPEWDRQDKAREVQLKDRGLPIGSEAWTDAENQVGDQRNKYLRGAANDSYIAGTQEEQRQYGNQAADYMRPYQTSQNSLGLLQSLNTLAPQASQPTATAATPDYGALVKQKYDADAKAYQDQMSGYGALASKGFGLLTAPMTGGASLGSSMLGQGASMLGQGASGMFNGGGGYSGSLHG